MLWHTLGNFENFIIQSCQNFSVVGFDLYPDDSCARFHMFGKESGANASERIYAEISANRREAKTAKHLLPVIFWKTTQNGAIGMAKEKKQKHFGKYTIRPTCSPFDVPTRNQFNPRGLTSVQSCDK